MHPVVTLMTPFKELAGRLSKEFPNVVTNVYSGNVGSLTEYQGYQIGIDCLLTDAPAERFNLHGGIPSLTLRVL
jgi:hypothetical protein